MRELLAAAQAERKTKLDAGRVETVFMVGDRVLLRTKQLPDTADIGTLRPRWDGPIRLTVQAPTLHPRPAPQDALQPDGQCRPPHALLRASRGGAGPVADAGQEGEHEAELLLSRRLVRGVTRYLVRWWGHASADDEWLRAEELAEELAHCQEKVAEYDATAPRRRAARRADPAAAPSSAPPAPAPAPLVPPAGFRLADSSEAWPGPRRQGRALPLAGGGLGPWHGGSQQPDGRVLARGAVWYGRASGLGPAVVPSLLYAASHGPGGRWVLLLRLSR